MVPYMSFVWQPYLKVLNDYSVSSLREQGLWLSVLQVLTKTLKFDEGGSFVRPFSRFDLMPDGYLQRFGVMTSYSN